MPVTLRPTDRSFRTKRAFAKPQRKAPQVQPSKPPPTQQAQSSWLPSEGQARTGPSFPLLLVSLHVLLLGLKLRPLHYAVPPVKLIEPD